MPEMGRAISNHTIYAREYNPDNPGYVIQALLQNQNTIEFLKLWEQANNPTFTFSACEDIQSKLRDNTFTLTAKSWIEQTMGSDNIPAVKGGEKWSPATVRSILGNERYMGDALLQKTYIADVLTKQK